MEEEERQPTDQGQRQGENQLAPEQTVGPWPIGLLLTLMPAGYLVMNGVLRRTFR